MGYDFLITMEIYMEFAPIKEGIHMICWEINMTKDSTNHLRA